jgi:hypothetical protein
MRTIEMRKLTQAEVDRHFMYVAGWGNWGEDEDIPRLRKVIHDKLHVNVSAAEAFVFWRWRSDQYDASWLIIGSDDEIVEWFLKYVPCEDD